MPQISELLAQMRRMHEAHAGNKGSARLILTALYREVRTSDERTFTGNAGQLSDFLTWFAEIVGQDQSRSQHYIHHCVHGLNAIKNAVHLLKGNFFPGIDPYKFGFQLALRIVNPSLIKTHRSGLSGHAAIITQMAIDWPSKYAETAVKLFINGRVMLNGLEVHPSDRTRLKFNSHQGGDCDGWFLESLKACKPEPVYRVGGLLGKSTAGELCNFLRATGCRGLEDHTFKLGLLRNSESERRRPRSADFVYPTNTAQGIRNLETMKSRIDDGYQVIMHSFELIGSRSPTSHDDYWHYVTELELNATHLIRITIFANGTWATWGKGPIRDFVRNYDGFICYLDNIGGVNPAGS